MSVSSPPDARTVTPDPDAVQNRILAAASSLMAEFGGRGTSIAAIAERAGLTDAGVLYHFKTKKDLLLAVVEQFDRDVERTVAASEMTGLELLQSTREWGAGMEQTPEIQSLLIVLSAEHLHEDDRARRYIQARYRRILERYEQAFRAAADAGDLRSDLDPVHEAQALVAHLDGIRLQWFLLDRTISMADSVRTYVDNLLTRLAPIPY